MFLRVLLISAAICCVVTSPILTPDANSHSWNWFLYDGRPALGLNFKRRGSDTIRGLGKYPAPCFDCGSSD